jgi:hypothetical protein
MSGVLKGLAAIQARIAQDEARNSGDYVKAEFFKLRDKEAVKGVFLQELDEESKHYSPKNGLGMVAIEHTNPNNFKRKAVCTLDDEGACWACEQHRKDYKAGWKQRPRIYINFLILGDEPSEHKVVVLSQGLSESQISPALFEQAGEFGTITEKVYKIKRTGAGFNDTSYLLTALADHDVNVEDYELFDLDKVVRHVPYAQQAAHYLDSVAGTDASPVEQRETVSASSGNAAVGTDPDDTW